MMDKNKQLPINFTGSELVTLLELLHVKCRSIQRAEYEDQIQPIMEEIEAVLYQQHLDFFYPLPIDSSNIKYPEYFYEDEGLE